MSRYTNIISKCIKTIANGSNQHSILKHMDLLDKSMAVYGSETPFTHSLIHSPQIFEGFLNAAFL